MISVVQFIDDLLMVFGLLLIKVISLKLIVHIFCASQSRHQGLKLSCWSRRLRQHCASSMMSAFLTILLWLVFV
jgi:hypothetical protein